MVNSTKNQSRSMFSHAQTVADPGFDQGGAKNLFPRFCQRSEAKSDKQSKQ